MAHQWVTKFLKRASNSGTVVITGKRVNRGAGYGLELPCEFKFQGHKFSCDWLEEKLCTLMYCNEKKKYWNVTSICTVLFRLKHCFYLGQYVIKTEPISLEIFLILFSVRLREVILDPADPK